MAAAVPLVLYARTATFDFVHADDADLIAGNLPFLSDLRNVPRAFERSYFEVEGELTAEKTYYRPVAIVSFMLNAAASGADPRYHHATNVVLHAAVSCLVLALAIAWGAPRAAALVAALVFAVHPLNAQAVAWIAGRNELLLAVFGLLSLLAFARLADPGDDRAIPPDRPGRTSDGRRPTGDDRRAGADEEPPTLDRPQPTDRPQQTSHRRAATAHGPRPTADGRRPPPDRPQPTAHRPHFAALHVLTFAAALFSKETALAFPLIAVLHGRLVTRARPTRVQSIALACDAVIVAVWAVLRARALDGMSLELSAETVRVVFANAPQLLVHLRKIVLPVQLNVAPGVQEVDLVLGAVALIALAVVFARYVAAPLRGLAVGWALLFLVPTFVVRAMPAYEHRAYLPLAGAAVCLAAAAGWARRRAPGEHHVGRAEMARPTRTFVAFSRTFRMSAVVPAIVVALASATFTRLPVFRDAFSYWTDAVRDPVFGPLANVNLGQLHERAGRLQDARREYLAALQRDGNTPKAHNNLGVVLMALDEPALATMHFKEETARHPWNADAWFNLGVAAETSGDAAAARRYYERAVEANPAYAPAREKLQTPNSQRPTPNSQRPTPNSQLPIPNAHSQFSSPNSRVPTPKRH